jgi:hypothetical protein
VILTIVVILVPFQLYRAYSQLQHSNSRFFFCFSVHSKMSAFRVLPLNFSIFPLKSLHVYCSYCCHYVLTNLFLFSWVLLSRIIDQLDLIIEGFCWEVGSLMMLLLPLQPLALESLRRLLYSNGVECVLILLTVLIYSNCALFLFFCSPK